MRVIKNGLDNRTFFSIAMINVLVSLLSLSIPLAAQTLINLIAFGKLLQPVITLSLIVLVLMLALGALDIWQSLIIEVIQQKLMVKISFEFTRKFTHLSLDHFSSHHGPELVNRYFEVVSIKKALASLLMYGINLALQLFFGLILLLFYHPLFLVFDIFIIVMLLLVIFLPYRAGLESAQKECSHKLAIGSWFDELLTNRFLFRFNKNDLFALHETDRRLASFLNIRNVHFRQLIRHQIGFYFLSAIASSLLLGLGGYLVIHNQLSLGQLVAAEIVLGALIYAFKRLSTLLENYYDLISSRNKIDGVLSLSNELIKTEFDELIFPIQVVELRFPNAQNAYCDTRSPLLICLENEKGAFCPADFIFGFDDYPDMTLLINNTLCLQEHRRAVRKHAVLLRSSEWFAGSVYDNLIMNHSASFIDKLQALLNKFGLMDKIMHQAGGLKSMIYDWDKFFTEYELLQLMVIRSILAEPQLLVVDGAFDKLNKSQIDLLLSEVIKLQHTLVIMITMHRSNFSITNRLVIS